MGKRINELGAGSALLGDELVEISRPSPTATITATTISAHAASDGGSFEDSGDGFTAAGFSEGDSVRVQGFDEDENNIFTGRITSLSDGVMVIGGTDGDGIVDEAAGDSVTITKWESRRATAADFLAKTNVSILTSSSGVVAIDCSLGDYFTLALTESVTSITFSNVADGRSLLIQITQDSTPRTVAWPASFTAAGGTLGSVSTGSGDVDVLAITTFDGGTSWRATLAKDFS